jgi:hypothetical protein
VTCIGQQCHRLVYDARYHLSNNKRTVQNDAGNKSLPVAVIECGIGSMMMMSMIM